MKFKKKTYKANTKEFLRELDTSITELSRRTNVSTTFLSNLVNGKAKCTYPVAYCIVKNLDSRLEVRDLFIEVE